MTKSAVRPKSARGKKRSWTRTPPPEHTPSTREWVDIARDVLIKTGIVEVKIDKLAKLAKVTRGGFYWRFKSREELLAALLEDWRETNTGALLSALQGAGTPLERLGALAQVYIEEKGFSAAYDNAVRNWAGLAPAVAEVLHKEDALRIDAIRKLFSDAGYEADEALIRARITYFHQVGYYAVGLQEGKGRRKELSKIYMRVLSGLG